MAAIPIAPFYLFVRALCRAESRRQSHVLTCPDRSSCAFDRGARSQKPRRRVGYNPRMRSVVERRLQPPRGEDHMTRAKIGLIALTAVVAWSTMIAAQAPSTPERKQAPGPLRFIGAQPCVNPEAGVIVCPSPAKTIAVRAGRLFDSVSGQMLTRQVVIVTGEKIVDVGPDGQVKVPAGAQVIDLSQATVLPGLID